MIPCTLMCVFGGNGSCHKKLGLVCKMEPEEGAQWDACETMGCAYRGYVYPPMGVAWLGLRSGIRSHLCHVH